MADLPKIIKITASDGISNHIITILSSTNKKRAFVKNQPRLDWQTVTQLKDLVPIRFAKNDV